MPSFFSDFLGPFPDVLWEPEFLSEAEHAALFEFCVNRIDWQQKQIFAGGRSVNIPRLLAWFGDVSYAYSGIKHPACPLPPPVDALRRRVEQYLAAQGIDRGLNSVLMNYYRGGQDSISLHSDDEAQLGEGSVIASVSLGAARTLVFQHKTLGLSHRNSLPGGSLLVMKGTCQKEWRHGIPKEEAGAPRVNLTFRLTRAEPAAR
jgi:alkylated DNA repair dioxygenase AlkB